MGERSLDLSASGSAGSGSHSPERFDRIPRSNFMQCSIALKFVER